MVKPILIGLSGQANVGKDTFSHFLKEEFYSQNNNTNPLFCIDLSFAKPIKDMIKLMYPDLPSICLDGPSEYRKSIIPDSWKNGSPLTVRQLLIDIGTELGRGYDDEIWLKNLDSRINAYKKESPVGVFIVTDARFPNEIRHLKNKGFTMIRILRETDTVINHASDTSQKEIPNEEFDYVINNNGTLSDFENQAKIVIKNSLEKRLF